MTFSVPPYLRDPDPAPGRPGRGEDAAGGRVEALARVLRTAMTTWAVCAHSEGRCAAHDEPEPCTAPHDVATELLADPGPLLATLAEAGVLREVTAPLKRNRRGEWIAVYYGNRTTEGSRYVTAWEPTDARP